MTSRNIYAEGPPVTVLEADPPWRHGDKLPGPKRGAEKHYAGGTLSLPEICRFPLPELASDAWLFLWTLHTHRREALVVAEAWGFIPVAKGEIVWVKTTKNGNVATGMGRTVRMAHEACLIFKRGRPVRANAGVKSVLLAQRREHSRKPDEFYAQAEKLVGPDGRKVSLFARERREGWECVGDEVPGAVVYSLPSRDEARNLLRFGSREGKKK